MILVTPEPAATLLAVAAYSGARRSEITGLQWPDYRDSALYVSRSITNGDVNHPKTRASAAPIPVVPYLAHLLDQHRERLGNPASGPMFPAGNGKPVSLNNVLCRVIKPALNRCEVCGKTKTKHAKEEHVFKRDARFPEWQGWHAFRRGLATILHDLGTDDKTIQAILRHSDVSVTQRCYIKTLPAQSIAAMNALESALCAECAPGAAVFAPATVN
jgi:integrase